MEDKVCFKCNQRLPIDQFYRHSAMSDGYLGKCKCCTKKDNKENRDKKVEYYLAYDKRRSKDEDRVKKRVENQKVSRKKNPEKYKARCMVNNAIRDGRLIKPCECETCGEVKKLEAHHEDYSKPLEVKWMCFERHRSHHDAFTDAYKSLKSTEEDKN